ncbi:MAG: CHAT domain-containing protein [Kofleriaceae bacterium]
MTKGGFEQRMVVLLLAAGAAAASCAHSATSTVQCDVDLSAKRDAVAACTAAYARSPSTETARLLVQAYAAHGDAAVTSLLVTNPVGPIAAEIWHQRANKIDDGHASVAAFQRALALRGSDLAGQVRELEALSERFEMMGDPRLALTTEARAVDVAARLNDPLVILHTRVTLATNLIAIGDDESGIRALGDTSSQLGERDPYLPIALITEGEYQRTHGHPLLARQTFSRAAALHGEHIQFVAHGNLIEVALALGDLHEAARLVETLPHPKGISHNWYAARVALARGTPAEALQFVDQAFAARPSMSFQPVLQTLRGEILVALGREQEAIIEFYRAINTFESQLEDLEIDELKTFAQRDPDRRAPYEQLFALYVRAGRPRDAFDISQRAIGRAYLDGLTATAPIVAQDPSAVAREAGIRADAMHVIATSLRSSCPSKVLSGDVLSHALVKDIIWTFFVANSHVWLIALDHGDPSVDDLGTVVELQPLIDGAIALREPSLAALGERLAPSPRWTGIGSNTVIHLAAGPLERVPFGALVLGGKRWIERAAFAYAPSAAVLVELRRRHSTNRSIVVIGDPHGDLPGARLEAIATAATLGVQAKLGADASVAAIKTSAHAQVLAVASHARVTPGGAELQLADGVVSAADVVDLGIAPELAVLASCQSAAVTGDAWGALAGAFLAAGTQNVIAARWSLDDATSRGLISEFYASGGVERPALGLAIAQRVAIAHQIPVSAWAALVALGTGETATERVNTNEQ